MLRINVVYLLFVLILILACVAFIFLKDWPSSNEGLVDDALGEPGLAVGSRTLVLRPGESFNLSEGVLVGFGGSGAEFSVPDVFFGGRSESGGSGGAGFLPLCNVVELYDGGRAVTLRKLECDSKGVVSGVNGSRVVDCKVDVDVEGLPAPDVPLTPVAKEIQGFDGARPVYRPSYVMAVQGEGVSVAPLLYVGIPEFFLQDWRNSSVGFVIGGPLGRGGSRDFKLEFRVVTNFGVGGIAYSPAELFDEASKDVRIGPAVVSISPRRFGVGDRCTGKDFSFNVSMRFDDDAGGYPLRVAGFSY